MAITLAAVQAAPTSRREQILAAFATRLGAQRTSARADMPANAISLTLDDLGETASYLDYGMEQIDINVRVEALYKGTATDHTPAFSNKLLAALDDEAAGADNTLGGLCDNILYTGGGPLLVDDPTTAIGAFAEFTLTYRNDYRNPYALTNP